ncbi:hypothetical protein TNCV_419161 [Trichonephila clavipes]|uniref:Uncharacterized protein n=1 Tax=Trichonephila clavipes TaxID=2585209 RepID=A0A8X6S4W9_TRICX|nr:hypothetical protein TNCV_419161 [Trichonephila clavipes]
MTLNHIGMQGPKCRRCRSKEAQKKNRNSSTFMGQINILLKGVQNYDQKSSEKPDSGAARNLLRLGICLFFIVTRGTLGFCETHFEDHRFKANKQKQQTMPNLEMRGRQKASDVNSTCELKSMTSPVGSSPADLAKCIEKSSPRGEIS